MPKGYYKKRNNWSQNDIEFMYDYAGIYSIDEMAEHLGRSRNAVILYRTRHKLPTVWDNVYTYTLLASELNRSRRILRKWVDRGWLIGKRATYASKYGKYAMLFQYDDIMCFLAKYYHLFIKQLPNNLFFANFIKDLITRTEVKNAIS